MWSGRRDSLRFRSVRLFCTHCLTPAADLSLPTPLKCACRCSLSVASHIIFMVFNRRTQTASSEASYGSLDTNSVVPHLQQSAQQTNEANNSRTARGNGQTTLFEHQSVSAINAGITANAEHLRSTAKRPVSTAKCLPKNKCIRMRAHASQREHCHFTRVKTRRAPIFHYQAGYSA